MTDSSSHDSTAGAPKRQRPRPVRPRARPRPRLRRAEPGESVPEAPRPDLPTAQAGDGRDASAAPDTARTPPAAGDPTRPDQSQCSSGRDYEVGYGKPPKHSQFQKGQSGNRKGRPKGSRNSEVILAELLAQKVAVNENGSRREVPMHEAILTRLVHDAARGEARAREQLLKLAAAVEQKKEARLAANAARPDEDASAAARARARVEHFTRTILEQHGRKAPDAVGH
jgi:hypothetical protein